MSKPLTEMQRKALADLDADGRQRHAAALARLDYLERKVQAAERLADAAHHLSHQAILAAACDYDEVQS